MPAQILYLFYILVMVIVFPFSAINFLFLNTNIFSDIKPFIVTTGSMEPAIPTGSLIYTVKENAYTKGDIVTYLADKGNIAHRIENFVNLSGMTYLSTKGDANITNDVDLVSERFVYGKTVLIIPFLGGVINFFKTPLGFCLGII